MSKSNKSRSDSNSRIIRVRDLPVYHDRKNDDIARYMPKLPEEEERHWLQRTLNKNKEFRLKIKNQTESLKMIVDRSLATLNTIRNDRTILPKVAVVTMAGLTPFLFGHKRKKFYSSLAALVALSACYPKQLTQFIDQMSRRNSTNSTLYKKRSTTNEKKM